MSRDEYDLLEILDEHTEVAFGELLRASGFERTELLELIGCGVLEPHGELVPES